MRTKTGLKHKIYTVDTEGNTLIIEIRLDDQCGNGHQDFAITASAFEKGRPRTDGNFLYGGCAHEEILAVRPDLEPFVRLHLSDYTGCPTYAVANGFYHLRNGFSSENTDHPDFKAEFCKYYRVTPEQFDTLNTSVSKIHYAILLKDLGILEQWKKEADEAILLIERLTGEKFEVNSSRTQYDEPTPEQLQEHFNRVQSGYYTEEAILQRNQENGERKLSEKLAHVQAKIEALEKEKAALREVFRVGGLAALENCIFYTHSLQIGFNWRSYDKISDELIEKVKTDGNFPEGVTITTK